MEGKTPNPAIEMSKPGDGPTESLVKALEKKCPANRGTYYDFVEALKDFTAQKSVIFGIISSAFCCSLYYYVSYLIAGLMLQPLCEGWMKYLMATGIHTWTTSCLHLHYPPSLPLRSINLHRSFWTNSRQGLEIDDQFHHFCKVFNRCNRRHPASRAQFANWARSLIGEDLDLLREFNQYFPYDF